MNFRHTVQTYKQPKFDDNKQLINKIAYLKMKVDLNELRGQNTKHIRATLAALENQLEQDTTVETDNIGKILK